MQARNGESISSSPEQTLYPFHSVCADFFTISSRNYLAFCDRYSGWLSVFKLPKDVTAYVIIILRDYCSTFVLDPQDLKVSRPNKRRGSDEH